MLDAKHIFKSLMRSKAGALMLLIQVAITTAIVSNAAFIIADRTKYLEQETGYAESSAFSFIVMTYGTDNPLPAQFKEDIDAIRQHPGVIDASLVGFVPLSGSGSARIFFKKSLPEDSLSFSASYLRADAATLNTLGVELLEGRNFRPEEVLLTDDPNALVNISIVSKGFADKMYPDGNALGKTFYDEDIPYKIVGITKPIKGPWLRSSMSDRTMMMPLARVSTYQKVVVRTQPEVRAKVMQEIEELMLTQYNKRVITQIEGLDDQKDKYNAKDILMKRMLITLIVMLVAITSLGIFGLTLFNISKRTKQIGTRRALGARKMHIIQYFLLESSFVCGAGILLGSIAAVILGDELIRTYSLPSLDVTYVMAAAAFVFVMSLLAAIMPAQRAANISPSIATRSV